MIDFKWVDGALTLEEPKGIVLLVRCHKDPKQVPGEVEWSCAIVINELNQYEPKILAGNRSPTLEEIKRIASYLTSQGYTGSWRRYKPNKKPKTVIIK